MANDLLKFKKGLHANLPEAYSAGTIYVTTDEKAMYVDIDNNTRIRLGQIVNFATLTAFQDFLKDTIPPYSKEAFYYVEDKNALLKWVSDDNTTSVGGVSTKGTWKQINGTQELQAAITANAEAISALDERVTALDKADGRIASIEGRVTAIDAATTGRMAVAEADIAALKATIGTNEEGETLGGRVTALEKEVHGEDGTGGLAGKITALEAKDGEIDEAIEGVKGLLTQHENTAGQTYATKTELANAKSAVLGQTDGVDFVGTVKEAYAKIEAEAARADAAEKANASAAAAAAQAASDADAKAVQAGKDAAAADAKAVAANDNAETRVLKSDFQAFEITNSAAIKKAQDAADAAGQAAADAQSDADDALEAIDVLNGTGVGSVSKAVADAEGRAAADATNKANTAEANAKAHADAEFVKTNAAVATAQSAAEAAQSTADGAQGTANQAVLDAAEALRVANTKATLDDVKGLDYATKEQAKGYADAKDGAIQAAQSAAEAAQGDADLNTAAIAKLNGAVTEDGSVAKIADDARKTAEAKAAELAGAAQTAAASYTDGKIAPVSEVANAAKSAAQENAAAIEILNGDDTVEGSVDSKVKAAKEALTTDINSKINAANAMIYKGEVASQDALDDIPEVSVGDTYVVSSEFGTKRPGDLLIAKSTYTETATGEVDGKIPAGYLDWDHVKTGYDATLEQTIETVDGKIQLTSAVGAANNGQISFVAATGSAATVSVANNTVTVGIEWDTF